MQPTYNIIDVIPNRHRNRFTPDSFEQDSVADSTPVVSICLFFFYVKSILLPLLRLIRSLQSQWRNVARIGINAGGTQTQSASPQQAEALMQPAYASQPIYKKNALNGRGVVRFSRGDTSGLSGQKLEMYTSATSSTKGFASNPFTSGTNE